MRTTYEIHMKSEISLCKIHEKLCISDLICTSWNEPPGPFNKLRQNTRIHIHKDTPYLGLTDEPWGVGFICHWSMHIFLDPVIEIKLSGSDKGSAMLQCTAEDTSGTPQLRLQYELFDGYPPDIIVIESNTKVGSGNINAVIQVPQLGWIVCFVTDEKGTYRKYKDLNAEGMSILFWIIVHTSYLLLELWSYMTVEPSESMHTKLLGAQIQDWFVVCWLAFIQKHRKWIEWYTSLSLW